MKYDVGFSSSIWRFGPWFFPQIFGVNEDGVQYTKFRTKNYIGVPIDITTIDNKFINGVYLDSHLLFGTTIRIENISGSNIILKNFKRKDAEEIQHLIQN